MDLSKLQPITIDDSWKYRLSRIVEDQDLVIDSRPLFRKFVAIGGIIGTACGIAATFGLTWPPLLCMIAGPVIGSGIAGAICRQFFRDLIYTHRSSVPEDRACRRLLTGRRDQLRDLRARVNVFNETLEARQQEDASFRRAGKEGGNVALYEEDVRQWHERHKNLTADVNAFAAHIEERFAVLVRNKRLAVIAAGLASIDAPTCGRPTKELTSLVTTAVVQQMNDDDRASLGLPSETSAKLLKTAK